MRKLLKQKIEYLSHRLVPTLVYATETNYSALFLFCSTPIIITTNWNSVCILFWEIEQLQFPRSGFFTLFMHIYEGRWIRAFQQIIWVKQKRILWNVTVLNWYLDNYYRYHNSELMLIIKRTHILIFFVIICEPSKRNYWTTLEEPL